MTATNRIQPTRDIQWLATEPSAHMSAVVPPAHATAPQMLAIRNRR
ncbi:hypothetical protein [Propionibacterium freudenreichii]|nr:hypothetical protein [Propionibacterium freudenreichii]